MVEQDTSDSIIIAATNHPAILDRALFRRFDDIIEYSLPTTKEIRAALEAKIAGSKTVSKIEWARLSTLAKGLSASFASTVQGSRRQSEPFQRSKSANVLGSRSPPDVGFYAGFFA
ncbi:MAG: hypothetical protein QOF56_1419 [Acidobacteriaceae bacterium]|jgi:SpoVK/Ycf46/Vps4 family AAA+-type ATPase|nr:hypothetical protein [Acidobacteriaceae bacterium]